MSAERSIVYFAYLGDAETDDTLMWRRLLFMERQLQWLAELCLMAQMPIDVTVAYTAPASRDAEVAHAAAARGFAIDPWSVAHRRHNSYEYPGFRALKDLSARRSPDSLIYYCHSKGITELSEGKMGLFLLHSYVGLTTDLADFAASPTLDRAGLFPSRRGWCWYNFFWIKAARMAALAVEESADRYHYESLIGDHADPEAYRRVLALVDRLSPSDTGIPAKPWYRAIETSSPVLEATYRRFAQMAVPPPPLGG